MLTSFEDRTETYKGHKLSYDIEYNLVIIEGVPDRFTTFSAARKWLDNPINTKEVVAQAIRDKSKPKAKSETESGSKAL